MSNRLQTAKVASELTDLRRQDGSYHPSDLVDWAAENPSSALHKEFAWDNKDAGHQWRLFQARRIIKRYAVVTEGADVTDVVPMLSVPSLRHGDDGSYLSKDVVASREDYRLEVLAEVQSKLRSMSSTYASLLPELKSVWAAVKRAC